MLFGLSFGWWIAIGYMILHSIMFIETNIRRLRDPIAYKAHYEAKNIPCPTKFEVLKLYIFGLISSFAFGAALTYFFG